MVSFEARKSSLTFPSFQKPCSYLLSFDNYLHKIKVNDIDVVTISEDEEKSSNEYYWGTFEAKERDLITIEIGNGDEGLGLLGNINFAPNSFFIGYKGGCYEKNKQRITYC